MLNLFNRKELIVTYDLREVNRIREMLLANRIDYYVKASYMRPNRAMGTDRNRVAFTRKQEQFTVYVHKTDWDHAMYLLRKNNN